MAGTIVFDRLESGAGAFVAADTVIKGCAKAWANFTGVGATNIRSSFNVTSITDNGVGDYTVNFAVPFANVDYAMAVGAGAVSYAASNQDIGVVGFKGDNGGVNPQTTTTSRIRTSTHSSLGNAPVDLITICVGFFAL